LAVSFGFSSIVLSLQDSILREPEAPPTIQRGAGFSGVVYAPAPSWYCFIASLVTLTSHSLEAAYPLFIRECRRFLIGGIFQDRFILT